MNISQVWTEKYRPTSMSEVLMSEKDMAIFEQMTNIPNNLLFIGSPGLGKTTVAKVLAKRFAPNSYMYINASEQGNIDTVRNLISDFISVSSIDGNQKIVILDEADGVSLPAQKALRGVMEEYLDNVKFILTANYKNKLIEAIRSRCQEFVFSVSEKQVMTRMVQILKQEKIVILKESIESLKLLLKTHFPDIRKTINELQSCCISGTFVYKIAQHSEFSQELKSVLGVKKDVFEVRQFVLDNLDRFGNDYHSLMKELFHLYVRECNSIACILISEYMYRSAFVLDQEVNFSALLFNLKAKLQ
jgi:DNA polymerase III delta prime subunit